MKTKNVVKRILAMMMVMALMLTTSMTAFAATGSRTYKAASKMTITLNPGQRGNSNTVRRCYYYKINCEHRINDLFGRSNCM